jgi:hypothetical protein
MKTLSHRRPGYIFLVTVLAVGAVVTLIVAVLLLLSTTVARSTISLEQSSRAFAYASGCIERVLYSLRSNSDGSTAFTLSYANGSCTVQPIAGYGNTDRTLCAEGVSGSVTRRFEIVISRILPSYKIASWKEVAVLTACSS